MDAGDAPSGCPSPSGRLNDPQAAAEQETMDYLEFFARVTSHIPDKGLVTVRYYGVYANAYRGKVRKTDDLRARPT